MICKHERKSISIIKSFSLIIAASLFSFSAAVKSAELPISINTYFNAPGFEKDATTTVEDKWIEAIDEALPNSKIYTTNYIFTQRRVAESLVRAALRNVDVQVLLDGRNQNYEKGSAVDILVNGYSDLPGINNCSDIPCINFCYGASIDSAMARTFTKGAIGNSCRGTMVNHNKFILLSHLASGDKYVVMQSSANFEREHLHRYNDLMVVANDVKLYNGFVNYWYLLKADKTERSRSFDFAGDSKIQVFTSPRPDNFDPVISVLNNINCKIPGSTIFASLADFGRMKIAESLRKLRDSGCKVRVLAKYNPELGQPTVDMKFEMKETLIIPKKSWENERNSIHTKFMIIDASYRGSDKKQKIVITGSQNFDEYSLKTNDEVQMIQINEKVYDEYLGFWSTIISDLIKSGGATAEMFD